MVNRRFVAALVVGGVIAAASAHAFVGPRVNHLTFSGAVALPGVTLGAGSYAFERLEQRADLVRVWNSDRTQALYTGFTRSVPRPRGLNPNQTLILGESVRGQAPPIVIWYPIGEANGHEFLYR